MLRSPTQFTKCLRPRVQYRPKRLILSTGQNSCLNLHLHPRPPSNAYCIPISSQNNSRQLLKMYHLAFRWKRHENQRWKIPLSPMTLSHHQTSIISPRLFWVIISLYEVISSVPLPPYIHISCRVQPTIICYIVFRCPL